MTVPENNPNNKEGNHKNLLTIALLLGVSGIAAFAGYGIGKNEGEAAFAAEQERDKFHHFIQLKELQEWAWQNGTGYTLMDGMMGVCYRLPEGATKKECSDTLLSRYDTAFGDVMAEQRKLMLNDEKLMGYVDGAESLHWRAGTKPPY